jgi:hypothetical protein
MKSIDYANVFDAASAGGVRVAQEDPLVRHLFHSLRNSLTSWTPRDLSVILVQFVIHRIQPPDHVLDDMLHSVRSGSLEVLVRGISGVAHLEHMPPRMFLKDFEDLIVANLAEVHLSSFPKALAF